MRRKAGRKSWEEELGVGAGSRSWEEEPDGRTDDDDDELKLSELLLPRKHENKIGDVRESWEEELGRGDEKESWEEELGGRAGSRSWE